MNINYLSKDSGQSVSSLNQNQVNVVVALEQIEPIPASNDANIVYLLFFLFV